MSFSPASIQTVEQPSDSLAWLDFHSISHPLGHLDWEDLDRLRLNWEAAQADPRVKAIVVQSPHRHFSPGWSPEAWLGQEAGRLREEVKLCRDFLRRLELSHKPVVAAVHGLCVGPGMELILACHAVVASIHSSTLAGVEERNLGLVPALGATVRLPLLVGLQTALHVLLSGKTYRYDDAIEMGLVDKLVSPDQLRHAAATLALELAKKRNPKRRAKSSLMQRQVERVWVGRRLIVNQTLQRLEETQNDAFDAPEHILYAADVAWRRGAREGLALALNLLMASWTNHGTKALLHLRKQALTRKAEGAMMAPHDPVRRITVLGGGRMGHGIVKLARKFDLDLHLVELSEDRLRELSTWAPKVGCQIYSSLDYHPSHAVECVMEAVDEQLDRKRQALVQVESYLGPGGILATNTSTFSIGELATSLRQPERLVGMHFFMPPGSMPLVEIVPSRFTSTDTLDKAKALASQLDKVWIVTLDRPGFFCTRVLGAYLHEGLRLLEEGADLAKVDYVLRKFGFLSGPFRFMDQAGLDLIHKVVEGPVRSRMESLGDRVAETGLRQLVEMGSLGQKSGQGFFLHKPDDPKPSTRRAEQDSPRYLINPKAYALFGGEERRRLSSVRIQHRMVLALVNEAVRCLEEGVISSPEDGDLGAVYGLGFPAFLGGPFRYSDHLGLSKLVGMLEELEEDYGPRFRPSGLLKEKVANRLPFFRKNSL